mgnify:CR=1 FL=1
MDKDSKYIHDAYISMAERTIKRLWILCIIMFLALAGSNVAWLYYENQFADEETTTIDALQDGSGINIVGSGGINYEPTSENYQD